MDDTPPQPPLLPSQSPQIQPQPPLPPSQPPQTQPQPLLQPTQPPQTQPQPQPQPQPLSLSSPLSIPPYNHNHSHSLLPFPPPTTPSSSSSTASHHKKRRSKLLCVDTNTNLNCELPPKRQNHSISTEVTPPCTECGKTFWSMKALFGHMRCHPERQWRGINLPSHLRHRPLPPTPTTTTTTTTNDREVAASLLLLASRPSSLDTVASPSSSVKFDCSSCKKTFGSHQALGGHRASHKNVKGCFAITKDTTDIDDDHIMAIHGGQSHEESVGLGLSLGLGVDHKCRVCLKVFPTRQALDGHMRCHWDKSSEEKHQQFQASSSSFGHALGPVSRPSEAQCGLDLNLSTQLDLRLGL